MNRRMFLRGVGGLLASGLAAVAVPVGRIRLDDPLPPPEDGILRERPVTLRGTMHLKLVEPGTGRVVKEGVYENLITDAGLEWLADCWGNLHTAATFRGLQRFALGTDNTAAAAGDTRLVAEYCRAAPFQTEQVAIASSATYRAVFRTFYAAASADCNIKEVGAFGGADAGDTADSGVLLSRVVVSGYDNSNGNYDVLLDWAFEFAEA